MQLNENKKINKIYDCPSYITLHVVIKISFVSLFHAY